MVNQYPPLSSMNRLEFFIEALFEHNNNPDSNGKTYGKTIASHYKNLPVPKTYTAKSVSPFSLDGINNMLNKWLKKELAEIRDSLPDNKIVDSFVKGISSGAGAVSGTEKLRFLIIMDFIKIYLDNGGDSTNLFNPKGFILLYCIHRLYSHEVNFNTMNYGDDKVLYKKLYKKYNANTLEIIKEYKSYKESIDFSVDDFFLIRAECCIYNYVVSNYDEIYKFIGKFIKDPASCTPTKRVVSTMFGEMEVDVNANYHTAQNSFNISNEDNTREEDNTNSTNVDCDNKEYHDNSDDDDAQTKIAEVIKELDALTGLQAAKQQVKQLIANVEINKQRMKHGLPTQEMSYHMVFQGSPGTGKTTVARIVAKAFKALDIISNGDMIEAHREDFVAEYLGQTANKTKKLMKRARGNILFIDEAYSLVNDDQNDSYGHEAVNVIIAEMENHRDNMVVILAGYNKEMDEFLASNSGFKSRISRYIDFEDYNADELTCIYKGILQKNLMTIDKAAEDMLYDIMKRAVRQKGDDFGNARFVRDLFQKTLEMQNLRLSGKAVDKKMLTTIYDVDIRRAYDNVNV